MKGWRLLVYELLIALPASLIIGTGVWLICKHIPNAIYHEPSRIGCLYRDVAENLLEHPEKASYSGVREKGWRQNGKINGISWGYVPDGDHVMVWHSAGKRMCRGVRVTVERPFPYALVFYWGGALAALVLIGLTAFAIWNFLRFVRARDDFLAATAHDLTTPLVGMRLMIGRCDEEAKRLNERMILIVNNIKEFLKLGRRREPEPKAVDVVALCKEAYQLFAADYEDSEGGAVAFDVHRLESTSLEVLADETMLLQILWNLFGNDLKYAAPYGKVCVWFSYEEGRAAVEFADNGQGMTPRQMRCAFDRYYRARTVLQSGKGGFGIGLCTAREFARAMGGDLQVRANVPRGCVFTLILPVA